MFEVLIFSAFAGAMIPLGGWIACHESISPGWLQQEFRHSVIAFGAGALLSAVALVLVPEGMESLPGVYAILLFSLGAAAMAGLHSWLTLKGIQKAQMLAMLTDFLPEAMAMGALFAIGPEATGPVLALLIGMQNLPESFNAFREAEQMPNARTPGRRLIGFALLALVGPAAGLTGFYLLADFPVLTGAIMCAAAGGILFLVFQDLAPQAKLETRVAPPLSGVAGFLVGIAGHVLLGAH